MNTNRIDMATAFNRYQFLGHEFILWLWYLSSKAPQLLDDIDTGHSVEITFGDSITVEVKGTRFPEKLTIKGMDAGFEEAFIALAKGGAIIQANMVITVSRPEQEQEFQFTLIGESLTVNGLKCHPGVESSSKDSDELEGAVIEMHYLTGIFFSSLDDLYRDFIDRRLASSWGSHLSGIRQWVSDQAKGLV